MIARYRWVKKRAPAAASGCDQNSTICGTAWRVADTKLAPKSIAAASTLARWAAGKASHNATANTYAYAFTSSTLGNQITFTDLSRWQLQIGAKIEF